KLPVKRNRGRNPRTEPAQPSSRRNFPELNQSMSAAIPSSTRAWTYSTSQPAPRMITARAASIIQVVGVQGALYPNTPGMDSTGKSQPDRKTAGNTVMKVNCMAVSRVLDRLEIHRPSPRVESVNGTWSNSSVKKQPFTGTVKTHHMSTTMPQNSTSV